MPSLFDPKTLKIGDRCPCHDSHKRRQVLQIEYATRRFACRPLTPIYEADGFDIIGWGVDYQSISGLTWHFFDEAAYRLGQQQEVNEWGEVAP